MERDSIIRRANRVVFRELSSDAGGVLLHLDTGEYHGVNDVGRLIWQLIGDGASLDQLIDGVRSETAGPPPNLDDDVKDFVSALVARSLLVIEG